MKRTPDQIKNWPSDKLFEFTGYNHPNTLRLLESNGFDGNPVLENHSTEKLIDAITNRELIIFSSSDVVRMALFFHLNDIETIIWLVKSQWERFLVAKTNRNDSDWFIKSGIASEFLHLFIDDPKSMKELASTRNLMDKYFGITQTRGLTTGTYESLLNFLLVSRTFYLPIESTEIANFIGNQNQLLEQLKIENSEYNDLFHARNKQWIELMQLAESAHIRLEVQRIENAESERTWMAVYGDVWYDLTKADITNQSLKRQIELKKKNPKWTLAQIEEADKTLVQNEMEILRQLETTIAINQLFAQTIVDYEWQGKVDMELMNRYKKVLRTIWLKTHPDKVNHKGFTPEQLELLQQFYRQATEMSATQRLINPLTLERLEELLSEVEQMYENMGLNITLNTTIKGNSLKDKVIWLESQIKTLENELTQLKNELFSLSNDATIKQKKESVKKAETIELVKTQMMEKKNLLDEELTELKKELDCLFEQV